MGVVLASNTCMSQGVHKAARRTAAVAPTHPHPTIQQSPGPPGRHRPAVDCALDFGLV